MRTVADVLQGDQELNQMRHQAAGLVVSELVAAYDERHLNAIKQANIEAQIAFSNEYWRLVNNHQHPTITDAGMMLSYALAKGTKRYEDGLIDKPIVLDNENLSVYRQLAMYFSGDFSMWPNTLNPRKGILLFGGYGVGKTEAMQLFASNPIQSFRRISARHMADEFRISGDISHYKGRFRNQCSQHCFGQREQGLCIDDLGAEADNVKRYGSSFDMGGLIQDRYDNPTTRGNFTHIITNATADELNETYGPRTYSRLKGSFNLIEFTESAQDRR